jgi:hypothetical protein
MTTCTPLKPFRCWQYRKDSGEAVPEWTRVGELKMDSYRLNGGWLVELDSGVVSWYTPAEFAERFKIVEES